MNSADKTTDSHGDTRRDTHGPIVTEEVKVSGEKIVATVKDLIREGNIRRIIIKNESGKTLFEIPLTFGVVGALVLPQLAALGAVGALIANLSITIERETPNEGETTGTVTPPAPATQIQEDFS